MRITILPGAVPATTFIDALINTMDEIGHDITVVGKKTGDYKYNKKVNVIVVPTSFRGRIGFIISILVATGFKHLGAIWKQSKSVEMLYHDLLFYLPIIKSNPDRIHFQWAAFVHNRDLLFELYPDKIVLSMRGAHINYTPITTLAIKESYLRLFPKVHRFHAVSEAIAEEALQYGSSLEKTDVIYSYVKEHTMDMPIQQRVVKDKLNIISVGRFFWKKGYEYALDALHILKKKGIPFTYTLIAEGETPASIIFQLHQTGLTEHVHIINGTSHSEVLKQIEQHEVLLLTSVEEGIANVAIEAMCVGTLVVTTDVGGMKELVQNRETGYIVPPRDIHAISGALIDINKMNQQERFDLAMRAKKKIKAKHNKDVFVSKFKEFYNK